jgi:hypothetical protein
MTPTHDRPQYKLEIKWPLPKRLKWTPTQLKQPWWWCLRRIWWLSKFSLGYFGPSNATNTTRTLYVCGWAICEWKREEWLDRTDKERADEYLRKWSACEKELQGFRLVALGADCAPEVKKVIRESWGVDLDEGTVK